MESNKNTKAIEKRIAAAAVKAGLKGRTIYEHGHWWIQVITPDEIKNYSVYDAEGPGSYEGFCFEEV